MDTMTPGPWSVSPMNASLICAGRALVALVLRDPNNNVPDCRVANAKVIATAPAMLEALKMSADLLDARSCTWAAKHLRAVIARATE